VKKCQNNALLLFGESWICGECYMKIHRKELDRKRQLVEEVEITG